MPIRNSKGQFVKNSKPMNGFKKGMTPWNKGLKGEYKIGTSEIKLLSVKKGKNHPLWKDKEVGYNALHSWVRRVLGKADHCSFNPIHASHRFEWANKSGKYLRNVNDWIQLCQKCHFKYDKQDLRLRDYHGRLI